MILVIERNPEKLSKWTVRIVQEETDKGALDVHQIRDILHRTIADLPKSMTNITVHPMDKRRKDDV